MTSKSMVERVGSLVEGGYDIDAAIMQALENEYNMICSLLNFGHLSEKGQSVCNAMAIKLWMHFNKTGERRKERNKLYRKMNEQLTKNTD